MFIWIFIKLLYRNRTGAYVCDRIMLMIPVMGTIVEKSTVARTMRTLGTLVQSGVPILESLNIVRDTAGNAVFERAFTRIYDSIREGETIAQPLREARIVDDIVVNMIDVGEETGDLDSMLNKIADNYDEEVEVLVESLVSLLEPIMIVVLGGIIGFIVIALFMPLIHADLEALGLILARGGGPRSALQSKTPIPGPVHSSLPGSMSRGGLHPKTTPAHRRRMTMTRPCPSHRSRRAGFTLVELLMVIVIIGILVALLIPAIAGAIRTANNARVTAEITNLVGSLEQFKGKYGDYPPSRVVLSESGSYNTTSTSSIAGMASNFIGTDSSNSSIYSGTDLTFGQLSQRSLQYIRKFFPKAVPPTNSTWHDFNGNGSMDSGYIYLQGHEALVFFLGGIPNHTSATTIGTSGFGRNPLFPFTNQITTAGAMYSDARTAPLYEFRADRLIDEDGDGIPGYVDTLNTGGSAQFFAYFSSYGNNMYDPNDVNLDSSMAETFNVKVGVAGNSETSPSPNPYTSDVPATSGQFPNFLKPTSFQIISAGADAVYGPGGQFVSNGNDDTLPVSGTAGANARMYEQDNLSNFTNGRFD